MNGPIGSAPLGRLIVGDNVPSSVAAMLSVAAGTAIDRSIIVTASSAAASSVVRSLTVNTSGSPVTFTDPVTLNRAVQVTGTAGVTFANAVSGSGQIIVSSPIVDLLVANSFTGGVALQSVGDTTSVLGVGDNGSLGTGPISVAVAGLLRADNGPRTLANAVQFAGGSYLGLVGANSRTVTGPTDLNGDIRRVENAAPGAVLTLGDVTGTGQSHLQVNQSGGEIFSSHGAVRLAGTGSYAGTTSVVTGLFLVDGTLTASMSAVTVNSGAILGGTCTINRPVTVNGALAPGDSPGVLAITRAVTMAGNSTFFVEANGPTPGANGYDQLNLIGGGSINLGSATLSVLLGNGYVPADSTHGDTLDIMTGASSITGQFAQGSSILVNSQYPVVILYGQTPGTVQLQFQPVPEPSALALAGIAAAAFVTRRVRRRCQVTADVRGRAA